MSKSVAPTSPSVPRHSVDRLWVQLRYRTDVETVELSKGRKLTVGRSPDADVVIESPELSRKHVSIELTDEGVRLTDLGSLNGTAVAGQRVSDAVLAVGEWAEFGGVTAVVVPAGEQVLGSQVVLPHEGFVHRLELALKETPRPTAVAMVRRDETYDPSAAAARSWAGAVRRLLRPVDRVGVFAPGWLEVVFDGAALDEAFVLGRQLVREAARTGEALRCGVAAFPESASNAEALLRLAEKAALEASSMNPVVKAAPYSSPTPAPELGRSPAMVELAATLKRIAPTAVAVLILGETGAGKEVVARTLHRHSGRGGGFHAVNCGALAPSLLESTLFGYERGAFTGADQARKGIFEEANGGTLFLDEIGELSAQGQAALLRVLETSRFTRVGSTLERATDVRVVAATHRDLPSMVQAGSFREDLYFRLEAVTLRVPALRERADDVATLAERFLHEAKAAHNCHAFGFTPEALGQLARYRWPGNVRELRNVVTRAALMAAGGQIGPADLGERFLMRRETMGIPRQTQPGSLGAAGNPVLSKLAYKERISGTEREVLLDALRATGWNQSAAARNLNIPRRTLAYKMKVLGLTPESS